MPEISFPRIIIFEHNQKCWDSQFELWKKKELKKCYPLLDDVNNASGSTILARMHRITLGGGYPDALFEGIPFKGKSFNIFQKTFALSFRKKSGMICHLL